MKDIDLENPFSIIDLPRKMVEALESVLSSAGIDIPAIFIQILLLVISAVLAFVLFKKNQPFCRKGIVSLLGLTACCLLVVSILFNWVMELVQPFPDKVSGHLIRQDRLPDNPLVGTRVSLLDIRKNEISLEGGRVDSDEGYFGVYYQKRFGDRPYYLLVTSPVCKQQRIKIPLSRLRARSPIDVDYVCEVNR